MKYIHAKLKLGSDVAVILFEAGILSRVGLGQPSLVWVWVWKISPEFPNFLPSSYIILTHPYTLDYTLKFLHNSSLHFTCHLWWVQVNFFWPGWGQVNFLLLRSGQPSLVWIWKISPKNPKFSIFSLRINLRGRVKKYPGQRQVIASCLLWVKSLLWSSWVRAHH